MFGGRFATGETPRSTTSASEADEGDGAGGDGGTGFDLFAAGKYGTLDTPISIHS